MLSSFKQSINKVINDSYYTIDDLCRSETAKARGISNTPPPKAKAALQAIITEVLDSLRSEYGGFIAVQSGYRSEELNKAIGGKANSQHLLGEAVDISAGSIKENRVLFRMLVKRGVFDQLIWEKGGKWIHVSYRSKEKNRGQILETRDGKKYKDIKSKWEKAIARPAPASAKKPSTKKKSTAKPAKKPATKPAKKPKEKPAAKPKAEPKPKAEKPAKSKPEKAKTEKPAKTKTEKPEKNKEKTPRNKKAK